MVHDTLKISGIICGTQNKFKNIVFFLVTAEEITNTISKLQNPCNFIYLSKTLAAHLTISRGTHIEKHCALMPQGTINAQINVLK